MSVIQSTRIFLRQGKQTRWMDSGITLLPDETLIVTAQDSYIGISEGHQFRAYPEGVYDMTLDPHPAFGPEDRLDAADFDLEDTDFLATNCKPYSLVVRIASDMDVFAQVGDAGQPDRSAIYDPADHDGGRVYVAVNDVVSAGHHPGFGVQSIIVILERESNDDPGPGETPSDPDPSSPRPFPITKVSPIRIVDAETLEQKQKAVQQTAWFWYVKPVYGESEAYNSTDKTLWCPRYENEFGLTGNVVPARNYLPFRGIDLTVVPTSIKLGIDAPDVRAIRLDRTKVLAGYYEGACVEVFEASMIGDRTGRTLHLVGHFGNCEAEDEVYTIELIPLEEKTSVPVGQRIQPICDVGRLVGETFARRRCNNEVLHDGPDIADLTRGAKVAQVYSLSKLVLTPFDTGDNPEYETDFKGSFGRIIGRSGDNSGVWRDVRTFDGVSGEITLRRPLPFVPQVDDVFEIEAGCDKTLEMCKEWDNILNFRGHPFVPGREAIRRRFNAGNNDD